MMLRHIFLYPKVHIKSTWHLDLTVCYGNPWRNLRHNQIYNLFHHTSPLLTFLASFYLRCNQKHNPHSYLLNIEFYPLSNWWLLCILLIFSKVESKRSPRHWLQHLYRQLIVYLYRHNGVSTNKQLSMLQVWQSFLQELI